MLCTLQLHGIGEVCSHVAAVLFFLETSTRFQGRATCTQEQGCSIISKKYTPVKDFDFTSAKGEKRKKDSALSVKHHLLQRIAKTSCH